MLALLLGAASAIAAREIEVSIVGWDAEGPLSGSALVLPDGSRVEADGAGRAVFTASDDWADFEVRIECPGYEERVLSIARDSPDRFVAVLRALPEGTIAEAAPPAEPPLAEAPPPEEPLAEPPLAEEAPSAEAPLSEAPPPQEEPPPEEPPPDEGLLAEEPLSEEPPAVGEASDAPTIVMRNLELFVIDGDLEEPLIGAAVMLTDGSRTETDGTGRAFVSVLPNAEAEIRVSYPGYDERTLRVRPGTAARFDIVLYMSTGVMEHEELVVEGRRPEVRGESGSVSLGGERMATAARIGLIEDVMAAVKLLPGVGYTGLFDALPSIRGGQPTDLGASLDGFYIDNPYHWGGGFTIFDPQSIASARLFHGVFSVRYTRTVSGLLELKSKTPSREYASLDVNLSTSAAGFNASMPLPDFSRPDGNPRGAMMLAGKVSYWDPFVTFAKGLAKFVTVLDPVKSVSTAPYIRSLTMLANYTVSPGLDLNLHGYAGGDGVEVMYDNLSGTGPLLTNSLIKFEWENLIAFLQSRLTFYPRPDMTVKALFGASYNTEYYLSDTTYKRDYGDDSQVVYTYDDATSGFQLRGDFDWDWGNNFLFSAGAEEIVRDWYETVETNMTLADRYGNDYLRTTPEIRNAGLMTGLYSLLEYRDPALRYAAEAGVRLDHFYLAGDGFSVNSMPVLNPRVNLDYYPVRERGNIGLLTLSAGTGLFSSVDETAAEIAKEYGVKDFDLKQAKSSTTVAGLKLDFLGNWSLIFETYYKYVFDRMYRTSVADSSATGNATARRKYNFDGDAHIAGFDMMLQKLEGRFVDGWISYSFNWARYRDPLRSEAFSGASFTDAFGSTRNSDRTGVWYYPYFHRFSNLNIVLNFKPRRDFSIYARTGFASGAPRFLVGEPNRLEEPTESGRLYTRNTRYSDSERSDPSIPLDLKFIWRFAYPGSRALTEVYVAVENAVSLVYSPDPPTTFNPYTGAEEPSGDITSFNLPIPMVSFGFRWSY